jgi:NAD(P)-dependent dehydrogenase (short-subunit alcohol dehydrogenase family)
MCWLAVETSLRNTTDTTFRQRAGYTKEMREELKRKIPVPRHARATQEVAALRALLASNDAGYITGGVYTVDGADTRVSRRAIRTLRMDSGGVRYPESRATIAG